MEKTIELLKDLTAELKADNDRAEKRQNAFERYAEKLEQIEEEQSNDFAVLNREEEAERWRKIDAEIKERKLTRNDPSDNDWAIYYRDVHGIGAY